MEHFYDGQVRRYLTQIIRLMSNFSYKDGKGVLTQVPVMYGDITRQVGTLLRDNSENKLPSAPRMAVYVGDLEMNTAMLADPTFVSKLHLRERAYDEDGKEYLNEAGKNFTVERLMPTPYMLGVNVDIWTTNTDQKLQILEQILMLFNPSLEIQTTDNYVDWTSLSVVNLDNINFSSRSIPTGTESEIDVATLGFKTPIYISPPTKVKRLGIITNIITSIFDETGNISSLNFSTFPSPLSTINATTETKITTNDEGDVVSDASSYSKLARGGDPPYTAGEALATLGMSHNHPSLLVLNNTIQLVKSGIVGGESWEGYLKAYPFTYEAGLTQVRLSRIDLTNEIIGTFAVDPNDLTVAVVNWDEDSLPTDTVLTGPTGDSAKINYIIDPTKSNPTNLKTVGSRILLLGAIGSSLNTDGADAWKNTNGTDFIADANDIVEWDGSAWTIVFDASTSTTVTYTTNLNTGIQYKWNLTDWVLSFEGEYPDGSWRLVF